MKEIISLFPNLTNNAMVRETTLRDVAEYIRSDKHLEESTKSFRTAADTDKADAVKRNSPAFLAPTRCNGKRGNSNLTALTGIALFDGDKIDPDKMQEKLALAKSDPHTLLCYTTISGHGIRVLFRYEWDETFDLPSQLRFYKRAFLCGNRYYANLLGCNYDEKCSDAGRLSVMAYDPDVYLNEQAEPFSPAAIDAADNNKTKKVKSAINKVDNVFTRHIEKYLQEKGCTFAPGSHNDYVMRVGYSMNKRGVPLDDALRWAIDKFGDAYRDTEQVVKSIYNAHPDDFGTLTDKNSEEPDNGEAREKKQSVPTATIKEIVGYLDERYTLRYNTVKEREEIVSLNDDDGTFRICDKRVRNSLVVHMSLDTDKRVRTLDMDTVINSDYAKDFNPIVAYLESLPEWKEGKDPDYIAELAKTVTVMGGARQQEYFESCLRVWLTALIASCLNPKFINHEVLTLIGGQGASKSTWFTSLIPPELDEYYKVNANGTERDGDQTLSLTYYMLICIDELTSMNEARATFYKTLITMKGSDMRAPYDARQKARTHLASFCATGNVLFFLNDQDEGRRWMPFMVKSMVQPDKDNRISFNHTGIYSQALALYKSGYRCYLNQEEIKKLTKHNDFYRTPCIERELILMNFRYPGPEEIGEFFPASEIKSILDSLTKERTSVAKITNIMTQLGFTEVRNGKLNGWLCIHLDYNEAKNRRKLMGLSGSIDVNP